MLFLDLASIHEKSEPVKSQVSAGYSYILDIADVSRGHIDFSSLCGSDFESAIPGDGQRSLQESAVVAVSRRVVTRSVAAPEEEIDDCDEWKEIVMVDVEEVAFVCRSHPSPVMIRAQL